MAQPGALRRCGPARWSLFLSWWSTLLAGHPVMALVRTEGVCVSRANLSRHTAAATGRCKTWGWGGCESAAAGSVVPVLVLVLVLPCVRSADGFIDDPRGDDV